MRRIKPRQLLAKDVEIDIGSCQHDIAELAIEIGTAGNGVFPHRFHGKPGAHRMSKDVHAADVRQLRESVNELAQGIARDGSAFLRRAIIEKTARRRPGIKHGNAAEPRVRHNLREPKTRLVVTCVKAMDLEQDIAV